MSIQPYKNLYHCMGHTYGTWLPGNTKGFRTRHHRQHVEGDYKHPPKENYAALLQHARSIMKRPPVELNIQQRKLALEAFVNSLLKRKIEVKVCAIDAVHFHILAPFPEHNPRHWIGIAKKESSHFLKINNCGIDGGVWAVRCECIPIEDAEHEENCEGYIADHAGRGAAVWMAMEVV
jgi:hypothetical protein